MTRSRFSFFLLLVLGLVACVRSQTPSQIPWADRLNSTARHQRRPNPWGRQYIPIRGHKNETLEDHGQNDIWLPRVFSLKKVDPLAVCNDGSGAPFYFRPGKDPTVWLVYMQGGEWCWSAESCAERWAASPWLMSNTGSQLAPPATFMGGIFQKSSVKNPMSQARFPIVGASRYKHSLCGCFHRPRPTSRTCRTAPATHGWAML
jgi:Pectinacetylesterase